MPGAPLLIRLPQKTAPKSPRHPCPATSTRSRGCFMGGQVIRRDGWEGLTIPVHHDEASMWTDGTAGADRGLI
jgi:hypothetical protein